MTTGKHHPVGAQVANAQAMTAQQWARVYGAPVPGCSRPVAEVLAERRGAAATGWSYAGPGPGR